MSLFDQLGEKTPTSYHKTSNNKVTMKPHGCGASTNTVNYFNGRIRAATILQAMKISSRTQITGYHLVKLKLTMILLQGEMYTLFLRIMPVTGTFYGDL